MARSRSSSCERDDVHVPVRAEPERQREAPVALARDAPVAHVAQPVLHALAEVRRRPLDGGVGVDHRLADLVAADEPLVHHAEDQLRPAAPAVRVAVLVGLPAGEPAAVLEVLGHEVGHLVRAVAGELAITVDEQPRLVDGHEHRQLLATADLEVLGAAARGDVDDSGPLVHDDLRVGDHAVGDLGLRGQVVEPGRVRAPDQLLAAHPADDARLRAEDGGAAILGDDVPLAADVDPDVARIGLDGGRHVRRQRPGRRRPDDERLARRVREAEAHVQRRVDDVAIGVGRRDLVLRQRRAAAQAPDHRAVALIQPATLVAELEEAPDVADVGVGHRVVRALPVHPHAEPARLRSLDAGVLRHAVAAGAREAIEPVGLDLVLRVEPERPLDLDFHPETLAVEAVLVALILAQRSVVTLEQVLQ